MAEGVTRVLRILELLSEAPASGVSSPELVERTGLASSTLYRLVGELEAAGYLYRDADRRLHPNFSFERRVDAGALLPGALRDACTELSAELGSASEAILPRGQNLLWHITAEHPSQALRLRAHPGYVRATYELDSISRLALAHLPIERIEREWDTSGFHAVGIERAKVSWAEARATLEAVAPDAMEHDLRGNAKGVRRFAVALPDTEGRLACLLTVAEAAVPLADEPAHVERIARALGAARSRLAAGATRSRSAADVPPARRRRAAP